MVNFSSSPRPSRKRRRKIRTVSRWGMLVTTTPRFNHEKYASQKPAIPKNNNNKNNISRSNASAGGEEVESKCN